MGRRSAGLAARAKAVDVVAGRAEWSSHAEARGVVADAMVGEQPEMVASGV